MEKLKHIFYPNIFSIEECYQIKIGFFDILNDGYEEHREINEYNQCPNTIGVVNLDEADIHVERLTSLVSKDYITNSNQKLKYENSYIRLYMKDSYLYHHIDRPGLDVTLSINIDGLENWKFYASNIPYTTWRADKNWDVFSDIERYSKDHQTFLTPRGSGVCCYGRRTVHWRYPLVCKDDEYVLQLFYHWAIV